MIRVYEYGLLPPITNADLIDGQLRAAHKYRNTLTELERKRRANVRAALSAHPDVEVIETRLAAARKERDDLREQILATRKHTRTRSEAPELRAKVKDASGNVRTLAQALKLAKATVAADAEVSAKIAAVNAAGADDVRTARGACGVYWGTYLMVEAAMDQARKSKTDPAFVRWTGNGNLGVQLQGGLPLADVWGTDTQLQIMPVSDRAHDPEVPRGERRRASRTTLRMRIGSQGRAPIWAEWPMIYHRQIPAAAVIKTATVVRVRRDCRSWFWSVKIMVHIPDDTFAGQAGTGRCALNLGWWKRPDGSYRAGYVVGDDGAEREIVMPFSVIDRLDKCASLRSIRDKNLDTMRTDLIEAIRTLELPEWLAQHKQYLHTWRSASRFAALVFKWRKERFAGDEAAHDIAEKWRYRDEHLERYESNMRRHAIRDRRETYRIIAAELARKYHTLIVDNTDLSELAERPKPEDTAVSIGSAQRHQTAPHVLRLALAGAFARAGTVRQEEAAYITVTCSSCRDVQARSTDGDRMYTCAACGETWDQDANAARNLLRAAIETDRLAELEGARDDKPVERKESRSERLRRGLKAAATQRSLAT